MLLVSVLQAAADWCRFVSGSGVGKRTFVVSMAIRCHLCFRAEDDTTASQLRKRLEPVQTIDVDGCFVTIKVACGQDSRDGVSMRDIKAIVVSWVRVTVAEASIASMTVSSIAQKSLRLHQVS